MKDYQLPKEFATKWVAALRSNKYEQGNYKLKCENQYCCLGVACDIVGFAQDFGDAQYIGGLNVTYGFKEELTPILDLIPVQLQGGQENGLVDKLTSMNDSGQSFFDIADWIEDNVDFV